jgi:hypothetical protein
VRGFLIIIVFIVKTIMNKKILNEVKRNRELMGLNESEVDEQLGAAIRQGIEKGYEKARSFFSRKKDTLDGTSGTLDGAREGVEITYDIGPKFTVFKYDTKGAINGYFILDMELEKLGLDTNPNYYQGTKNNIATYKIPNEEIPESFFGEGDKSDTSSKPQNFTIEYNDKSYAVDFDTLTANTRNGYFDIDGVRFYYGIGTPNTSQSDITARSNKIKDIKGPTSSETKVTNNDDGSTTTTKTDVTLASTNDDNRLKIVSITPRFLNLGNSRKEITVGI